ATAAEELEALRFALRRLVRAHGDAATRAAMADLARDAAYRLDALLFAPVRRWLDEGELVVVPVGALHATPWALLPTCRRRPVAVAPSASAWLAAIESDRPDPDRPDRERPVLVAGPGLAHAHAEVRRLAGTLEPAHVLTGEHARAEEVLKALD